MQKEDENKNKIENISDKLFKKIYNLNSSRSPTVINIEKNII